MKAPVLLKSILTLCDLLKHEAIYNRKMKKEKFLIYRNSCTDYKTNKPLLHAFDVVMLHSKFSKQDAVMIIIELKFLQVLMSLADNIGYYVCYYI